MVRSELAEHDLASAQNGTLGDWHRHIGRYMCRQFASGAVHVGVGRRPRC
jgi:hypothetical protein